MDSKIDSILRLKFVGDLGGDEGRNSQVKKAYDPQLNSTFAVKIIPKEKLIEEFGTDDDNMFFNESKMIYSNQHPNIVEIQHASFCDANVYFTMPYYQNGSLNQLLNQRCLTVREIIKISLEFLSGIHYIHTNNLIHFDIKPTNILLNDNMKAMVTDFGLSKYTDNYGVAKYSKFYTVHYPPECIEVDVTTKSADIYQAGLTIYRMCNGNNSVRKQYNDLLSKGREHLIKAIRTEKFPKRSYLPHIPLKLRKVVNKALKPNPDDRFATILDMMNELSKVEENLDIRFYMEGDSVLVWEKDTSDTHYDKIKLNLDRSSVVTSGRKVNTRNGTEKNISCLNRSGYKNTKEALRIVEKYIKG